MIPNAWLEAGAGHLIPLAAMVGFLIIAIVAAARSEKMTGAFLFLVLAILVILAFMSFCNGMRIDGLEDRLEALEKRRRQQ